MGASPKALKAAVETGIVESNLTNVRHGTSDSQGVFQQRPSQGWGSVAQVTNVEHAARKFFEQAIPAHGKYGSAGQLAQAVQRSAYPARYDQQSARASSLMGNAGSSSARAASTTSIDPLARARIVSNYLNSKAPNDPLALAASLAGAKQVTTSAPKTPASSSPTGTGTANFEGKQVAQWIKPALDYARANGWTGVVNSGYRSFKDQTRIYNSGVRPAAKPGTSNHEGSAFPRGAVDVSNPQQLAKILRSSPYKSKLVWAGGVDPVHFSHPHGGSY